MAENHRVSSFYTGAMLRYNLDDVVIDEMLAAHGLAVTEDNIQECVAAIRGDLNYKGHYPAPQPPASWGAGNTILLLEHYDPGE